MDLLLRDRYEALEVVGDGGHGSVIRARDRLHDRLVAVKVRRCGPGADREQVVREAGLLLRVRPHPLLPLVREDFFDGDRYCVVMDWIDGTDLAELLAKQGRPGLPLDDVVDALVHVAAALDHLHGHDPPVVHGDVKPANVVRTGDGRAVLVDFGTAAVAAGGHGPAWGTTGFMAPETVSGAPLSVAADVFSLAATAFALLTGAPPSPGARPNWTSLAGGRARAVELTLRQGLAFDPSRRPATAAALVEGLRGRPSVPTNLPLEPKTFVGREAELAGLGALLEAERLVTVVGTAGAGKSHLCRQLAGRAKERFADGVHLVELASVDDGERVAEEVRFAVGLTAPPTRPALDVLVDHLATRRALLVIDNCEHLIDACAVLVETVLRRCPHVRVLATSREPLRVAGESAWRLPPLSDDDAAALFVTRARAANPALRLGERDRPAVLRVCRRLDGLPLAVELAAARVTALSLDELARCLDDQLELLTAGPTTTARHRTLRAALEWTHDGLPGDERALYRRLSVFAGGFTLDGVLAVAADPGASRGRQAGLLANLVDKSVVVAEGLVERERWAGATRYRLLEALREFGREALAAAGEVDEVEARHLAWARALAEQADAALGGPDQSQWLDVLEAEHDNLRAALGRTGDLALAAALARFWEMRGHWTEGRRWLARVLDANPPATAEAAVRGRALHGAGVLAMRQGDNEAARALHEESMEISEALDDRSGVAASLLALGNVATGQGDHSGAARRYEECVAVASQVGSRAAEASACANLGWLAAMQWDPSRAVQLLEHALSLRRALGDAHGVATVSTVLGHVRRNQGQYDAARALHDESLAIQRRLGDLHGAAWSLTHRGLLDQWQGHPDAARPLHEEALAIRRDIGDRSGAAWSLLHLADACVAQGELAAAGPLLDESLSLGRALEDPWCINKGLTCGGRLARAAGALDLAAARLTEALALAVRHRFELAVATCLQALGGLAVDRGDHVAAARLFGAADARRRSVRGVVHPWEQEGNDRDIDVATRALGPVVYRTAFAEGAVLAPEDLVPAINSFL